MCVNDAIIIGDCTAGSVHSNFELKKFPEAGTIHYIFQMDWKRDICYRAREILVIIVTPGNLP